MGMLTVPQVTVYWGETNLSDYTLPGATSPEPLVYNVEVSIGSDNQWPTGSFEWNPTGPAFAVYEELVTQKQDEVITVTFGYHNFAQGPKIPFAFQYSGTEISYGVDMTVKILLACRSAAQSSQTRNSVSLNYAEKFDDKGKDMKQITEEVNSTYTTNVPLVWTECAEKDAKEVKAARTQFKDQTYGSVNLNTQKELGNKILLSNINSTGEQVVFPPFMWEKKQKCGTVSQPEQVPKANKRYGYLIGPGIITTFTRKMEYTPPTEDKTGTAGGTKAPPQPKNKRTKTPGENTTGMTKPSEEATKENKQSVQNASSPSNVQGRQYTENKNGPQKQAILNEEEGVKMDATIFMCPAVTGIKPQDIVYVPSLSGDRIEDYKVTSVSYSQDGGTFAVSLQCVRAYGLSTAMNQEAAKPFLEKAKSLKTLEDWSNYAWRERLGLPSV